MASVVAAQDDDDDDDGAWTADVNEMSAATRARLRIMATLASRAGMYPKAVELWSRLVDGGADTAALCNLAAALTGAAAGDDGRNEEAVRAYERALAALSDNDVEQRAACRANLAALLIRLGRCAEAKEHCFLSFKEHEAIGRPAPSHVLYNANTALRQLGEQREAIELSSRIICECHPRPEEARLAFLDRATTRDEAASTGLTVVCVKWGSKYGAEYVNRLKRGVRRHLTLEHSFICFTDDPKGLDDDIIARPLPERPLKSWWLKAFLFSREADLRERVLYLDLDTVIVGSLDALATHRGSFAVLGTGEMSNERRSGGYNSSVMIWTAPNHSRVYSLLSDAAAYDAVTGVVYKFDHWLEMLFDDKSAEILQDALPGLVVEYARVCASSENPPPEASVVCFPLEPKPHGVNAPWIDRHWRQLPPVDL